MTTGSAIENADNMRVGYEQLCHSYHAIDDFRAKLLGILPVVTGGGVVLTGKGEHTDEGLLILVGIFGFVMTFGLFVYELYGIRKCHALLITGMALEIALRLEFDVRPEYAPRVVDVGQFQNRPRALLTTAKQGRSSAEQSESSRGRFWRPAVNEPFAAAIIYPGVMSAWLYLAMYHTPLPLGLGVATIIFIAGLVGTIRYNHQLGIDAHNQIEWIFNRLAGRKKFAVDEESIKSRS